MKKNFKAHALILCGALLVGCTQERKEPNIEPIQDMMVNPSMKAQGEDLSKPDQRANFYPPEGAIPRGFTPYTITDSLVAEKELVNPFAGQISTNPRGEKLFHTYCFVCHGTVGKGDGPVAVKWPTPIPSLLSTKIRGWKDGGIYHLIRAGRGMMRSYEAQINNDADRWAVVNYVRFLQKTQPVFEGGMPLQQAPTN